MVELGKIDLHIVSFDVPFPADYGGVIDVYYKLKALHGIGVKIHLHCFEYGRKRALELNQFCQKISYYKRDTSFTNVFSKVPYIVKSRMNYELLNNLLIDQHPILFEGLHCCGFLANDELKNRFKIVRTHNVEHFYYLGLAQAELGLIKQQYFNLESQKLERFESVLSNASVIMPLSISDKLYFEKYQTKVQYLPPFVEQFELVNNEQTIDFCIYHGNLSVAENIKAVFFLLEVFSSLKYKLIIAGKNPNAKMKQRISHFKNVELIENPGDIELNHLIQSAKLNCLPTFQATGIKLKLIKSLMLGNDVLVNHEMLEGNNLEQYCIVAKTKNQWQQKIKEVFASKPNSIELKKRRLAVSIEFDNLRNAKLLKELLA